MKKLVLLALVFVLIFSACSNWSVEIKDPQSSAESSSEIELVDDGGSEQENPAEVFYLVNGGNAWLDGGETFVIQDGFTVRYINKNNEVEKEITLAPQNTDTAGRCVFSNDRIFMPYDTKNADVSWITQPLAVQIDGEWKLYGGAFFDRDGNLIRELPYVENHNSVNNVTKLSTGEELNIYGNGAVSCEKKLWLGKNTMVFGDNRRLFFYDISADKLTLAVDFSDEVPEGKGGIYHGIYEISAKGDGCFFTYNEDTGIYNVTKLGYTEGMDFEKIFGADEKIYIGLAGENAVLTERTYNQERDCDDETKISYIDESGEEKLIADLPGGLSIEHWGSERIDMSFSHIRDNIYYLCSYDLATGELVEFQPDDNGEGMGAYRDVFTAKIDGKLCWLMSEFYDGMNHFVIYDGATGEKLPLWESGYLVGEQFHEPNADGSAFTVEKDEETDSGTNIWIKVVNTESLLKRTE